MPNIDYLPPQEIDSEKIVLGSMIIDKKCCSAAIEKLNEKEFYHNWHSTIFSAIKDLFLKNIPVDTSTVIDKLKNEKEIDFEFLLSLTENIVTVGNLPFHFSKIREASSLRVIVETCQNAIDSVLSGSDVESASVSSKLISSLLQAGNEGSEDIKRIDELVYDELDTLNRIQNGEKVAFIETGIKFIDEKICIEQYDIICIAGRPSNFKSSLAGCIARNLAKQGKVVLKITMDSTSKKEASRDLFSESKINRSKFYSGFGSKLEHRNLIINSGMFSDMKIYYDDCPENSPGKIYAKALNVKNKEGRLDAIFIDYMQQVDSDENVKTVREKVTKVSRAIKKLPKFIGCPIFPISQISRYLNENTMEPELHHLKESGDIEADIDGCIITYYPNKYDSSKPKNDISIIIAKNKNGQIGKRTLNVFPEYFLITDRAKQEENKQVEQEYMWYQK